MLLWEIHPYHLHTIMKYLPIKHILKVFISYTDKSVLIIIQKDKIGWQGLRHWNLEAGEIKWVWQERRQDPARRRKEMSVRTGLLFFIYNCVSHSKNPVIPPSQSLLPTDSTENVPLMTHWFLWRIERKGRHYSNDYELLLSNESSSITGR